MYFYNLIITCIAPLCFCQDLQNLDVVKSNIRIKREPEKYRHEIPKNIRDINKVQLSKSKLTKFKESKPSDRVPWIQKSKETITVPPKLKQKPVQHFKPHATAYIRKNNIPPNRKEAEKNIVQPESTLNNINVKNNVTSKGFINNEPLISNAEINNLQKQVTAKPTYLVKNEDKDIKETIKPQLTTQTPQIDSQIEKPKTKFKDRIDILLDGVGKRKYTHLENDLPEISKNAVVSQPSKEINQEQLDKTFHESDASSKETKDSMQSAEKTIEIPDQLERPKEVNQLNKESNLNSTTGKETNFLDKNTTNEFKISKSKDKIIVPLDAHSTDNLLKTSVAGQTVDTTKNSLAQPAVQELKNEGNDDVFYLTKPLMDSLKNKTIELIEIKQRNFTEFVEKQPTLNDSNEPYYQTTSWQRYETQTPKNEYQDSYQPDVTYVPPSYEYPYSNKFNLQNSYYKSKPHFENFQYRANEEALKKTWRSWVNTEVIIKTSMNHPHDIEIQPVTADQLSVKNVNYNNIAHSDAKPAYTSYPCYVYPSICYGATNGYYQ